MAKVIWRQTHFMSQNSTQPRELKPSFLEPLHGAPLVQCEFGGNYMVFINFLTVRCGAVRCGVVTTLCSGTVGTLHESTGRVCILMAISKKTESTFVEPNIIIKPNAATVSEVLHVQ